MGGTSMTDKIQPDQKEAYANKNQKALNKRQSRKRNFESSNLDATCHNLALFKALGITSHLLLCQQHKTSRHFFFKGAFCKMHPAEFPLKTTERYLQVNTEETAP